MTMTPTYFCLSQKYYCPHFCPLFCPLAAFLFTLKCLSAREPWEKLTHCPNETRDISRTTLRILEKLTNIAVFASPPLVADFFAFFTAREVAVTVIAGLTPVHALGTEVIMLTDESVAVLERLHAQSVGVIRPRLADRQGARAHHPFEQLILASCWKRGKGKGKDIVKHCFGIYQKVVSTAFFERGKNNKWFRCVFF